MATFQRRPDRVEAFQWFGDRSDNVLPAWFLEAEIVGEVAREGELVRCSAPAGQTFAEPGDWVVWENNSFRSYAPREFAAIFCPL